MPLCLLITLAIVDRLLAEHYYVTFGLWYDSSVHHLTVCRLSLTFVRPAQRIGLFGNIFVPSNSTGLANLGSLY